MNDAINNSLIELRNAIASLPVGPERLAAEQKCEALRATLQAFSYQTASVPPVPRQSMSSLSMRNVLERAYRADPKATEMDLCDAGRRDLASELGAAHLSEEYRREQARPQLELAVG